MSEYFSTKSTSTDQWLGSKVTGDDSGKWRFVVEADGKIRWAQGGSSSSDVILQRSNFSQLNPSDAGYWAFPLLTLYRGNGTTAGDLQLGTIRLKDSGTIIKCFSDFHTELDIKPGFEPNDYRVHLYCTTINPNDRRYGPLDPMLSTDYAFFVEKDFKTFGFVGTSSDPEKQMGGGAIQMGQGFTGKYCPPMFNLTGTLTADDERAKIMYNYGSTLPGSANDRDVFYNTSDKKIYQYITGSGWRFLSTVDAIGGYSSGTSMPGSPENAQWFYRTDEKKLYQYKIGSGWTEMFSNVQSDKYDTLFLMKADGTDSSNRPANLHLGNLTALDKIYVVGGVIKVGTTSAGGDVGGQIEVTSAQPTLYAGSLALVSNAAQAAGIGGVLTFRGTYDAGGNTAAYAAIGGLKANSSAGNYEGILRFYVRTSGAALDNVMSLDRAGNLTANGQIYATGSFKTGMGNMYSDNAFAFLTNAGAAQIGKFKGLLAATSYAYTPPDAGIQFEGDCRIVRANVGVMSVQGYSAGSWGLGTLNSSNIFTDHINSASAGGIYILDALRGDGNNEIFCNAKFYGCGTWLTYDWQNKANTIYSEISNDVTNYQALMIVGNSSGGSGIRRVKLWDQLKVNGTLFVTSDIYVGAYDDVRFHRSASGVVQVLDAGGSLATLDASNLIADHINSASGANIYFMDHLRAYSALNIMPNANNSGNIGGNGSSTNYYWGAVYANYLMYHSNHTAFDHVNDLDLVKSYKTKTDETGKSVIDDASLPFLRDAEGFFRPDRVNGFLLGCAKATAIKHDEQDDRVNAILSRIQALENQIQAAQA